MMMIVAMMIVAMMMVYDADDSGNDDADDDGEPVVSYLSTTFNISMYAQSACNTISHALDMEDSRCNI